MAPTLVSVIVPCRNEAAHVEAFCDAVAAQRLPDGVALEVLIADGRSDDGTRAKLEARAAADARFVVIDNPGRIVSTGLNACIARARGEVIARLDVHTLYADDYLAQCLDALARSGAANVGGPWRADFQGGPRRADFQGAPQHADFQGAPQRAQGEGTTGRAIAAAFQSRWVAGGARSRDLAYEGPVDTVYLGCWPREVFAQHGGFDETLVRNQDDEHNLRLVKAGALVWQTPRVRSSYTPRASLGRLFEQQRQYGRWKPAVMCKHRRVGSWRPFAPGALVGGMVVLGVATAASHWMPLEAAAWVQLAFGLLLGSYALYLIAATLAIARSLPKPRAAIAGDLPAVIATMQLGYGIGLWQGLLALPFKRRAKPADASLSR